MLGEFRQEISIMKRLRHPHIVQFVSRSSACCARCDLRAAGAPATAGRGNTQWAEAAACRQQRLEHAKMLSGVVQLPMSRARPRPFPSAPQLGAVTQPPHLCIVTQFVPRGACLASPCCWF